MVEVKGNLWTFPADYRIITTNGTINKKGECVMGRGCALEAKRRYPELPKMLARLIRNHGNKVWSLSHHLISFPVKHNWWEKADLKLIEESAHTLNRQIGGYCLKTRFVMPRPGCGNGGRTWDEVKPIISFLPDNVFVIDFK